MDARAESLGPRSADLSTKRVVGFACNQAFQPEQARGGHFYL